MMAEAMKRHYRMLALSALAGMLIVVAGVAAALPAIAATQHDCACRVQLAAQL